MKNVKVTAKFDIHQGKLDEFKNLVNQIIERVRDMDSGTLVYDFFINDERMECITTEVFENSATALEHAGNVGEILSNMMEITDMKLWIYGDVSDELRNGLEPLGAKIYPFYSGL